MNDNTLPKRIHKWRTFKATANIPRSCHASKFTLSAECKMLKVSKTFKGLQLVLATIHIEKCMIIRKRLHKFSIQSRRARRKLLWSQKYINKDKRGVNQIHHCRKRISDRLWFDNFEMSLVFFFFFLFPFFYLAYSAAAALRFLLGLCELLKENIHCF